MACTPSEYSDQPRHLPSLITVFAVGMKKAWVLSYPLSAQRRLRSDWTDAQANLSRHLVQSLCWFCHEAAQYRNDKSVIKFINFAFYLLFKATNS